MTRLVVRQHRVGMRLALGGVRRGNRVNNRLGLLVADFFIPARQNLALPPSPGRGMSGLTLVVVDYISEMVLSAVVRATHAHGVVRQVDVAVVALGKIVRFAIVVG